MNLRQLFKHAANHHQEDKSGILENVLNAQPEHAVSESRTTRRWSKTVAATAAALALFVSISMVGIAIVALSPKTVKLELTPGAATVSQGDTVTLTAGLADKSPEFKKGVVGLTMDIQYDSTRLTYETDGSITSYLGSDFDVSAHEAETGTITVLVYPTNVDEYNKLCAADNGNLFSIPLKVKSDAPAGAAAFTPKDCNFADYKDDESGFELVSVTLPAPTSVTVSAGTYSISVDSALTGEVTVSTSTAAAGARIEVTIGDMGTQRLAGGMLSWKYTDGENTVCRPMYARVGSVVNDLVDGIPADSTNNESNGSTFFFIMPAANVTVTGTKVDADQEETAAGTAFLKVFGASYREPVGATQAGLQFASRAYRQVTIDGVIYTLQSCGTRLRNTVSGETRNVATEVLYDRSNNHIDYAARIVYAVDSQNLGTPYTATAYATYVANGYPSITLESAESGARSYTEAYTLAQG